MYPSLSSEHLAEEAVAEACGRTLRSHHRRAHLRPLADGLDEAGEKGPAGGRAVSGDGTAKGRRGRKTVLTAHMPQHMREWLRRMCDEIRDRRAMPPRYRERYERLAREADARKKAERDEDDERG